MSDNEKVTVQPLWVEFKERAGYGFRIVRVSWELGEPRISFYTEWSSRAYTVRSPISFTLAEIEAYLRKAERALTRKEPSDEDSEGTGLLGQ